MTKPILRLALQKSGRLAQKSMAILEKAGIDIPEFDRILKIKARNFPLEILLLRTSDIPEVVSDDAADLCILGQNSLMESMHYLELEELRKLKFGRCRLSLAVPVQSPITSAKELNGKIIATSHPVLLQKYLYQHKLSADVLPMSGSVEIAPELGVADAICDLISSGSTLQANNLRELELIFASEAVLIANKTIAAEKQAILEEFLLRIDSVVNASSLKSVIMNAPRSELPAIEKILPGLDSPTITPLAKEGWIAIHSVVEEDEDFWRKMRKLKEAGASGILVMPIERVIY